MYSVEDLLISHGYKLPKPSTPTPGPLARTMPLASPPSYRRERLLERPRTVNGFERGSTGLYRCSINNSEDQNRNQSQQEGPPGGSLPPDTRFCEVTHGPQLQSKDVSYWRRKGQDFAVLLDYTDYKDAAGGRQGNYMRQERPQQARGQEPADERQSTDRQQWGGQPISRDREQPLHWRTAERKCQSLGAEEWHPSGERCTQEQQRLHARTPEGMVHPRIKAKTQSLPRMLRPDSLQYVGRGSGQELFKRVSGQPLFHQSIYRAPRWPDSSRPASAVQLSITPKPRFTRPPRPPSYEMHQQIRGSCEVLSGRDSVHPPTRDRTPLPMLRTEETQMDYFAQDSGPPGYIPPPSYKRAPIMGGGCRKYGEVAINYRYRGDVYHQVHVAPDGSHWFPRQVSHQRQLYPVYNTQERATGRVQYIPFDDPHISHISSAMGGNSLTDADKIRHIRKELPNVTVSEPASSNSAFLPPQLGPSIIGKLGNDSIPSSSREFDNDNTRWHSNLHKETVDNIPATDQNCNNRYHRIHHASPASPFSAFHAPKTEFRCSSEQGFLETVTQVKQISPDSGLDSNRNSKRRVSETIFCLVSVPVHTPTNFNKDTASDQNNNDTTSSLTHPDTFAVGLKESRPVRSKSVNQVPIWGHYSHFYTSSTSSLRNYKRAPLRKEIIDAWALQANEDRDLYSKSWPGNQYRNQETQTGSPLTVVKSPEHQISKEKATQSISDMGSDSVGVVDRTSSNGYLIEGQKKLQLSSNSAFSLLSPTQSTSIEASPPQPASPSTEPNRDHQLTSSPNKKSPSHNPPDNPAETAEQVAFGQFLLKPVNRRPCDYIGALESINKEMEDTISKRPNDGVCRGTKKLNLHQSGVQSVEEIHVEKPSHIKVRSKSSADLDFMESSSSFFGPHESIPSIGQPSGSRDNLLSSVSQDEEPIHQDIPVPQESLLKDVGLTVYTETGQREHVPRSCSVPPLQKFEEWDCRKTTVSRDNNKEFKSKPDHKHHLSGVSLRICRSRSESSRSSHKRECSPHVIKLNREVACLYNDDDLDNRYAIPRAQISTNEPTIADTHLENLLIQEKANSLAAEDLRNLYQVKCAEGIPENESIEERAARILGIAVPVEALGVADKDDMVNIEVAKQEVIGGSVEVQRQLMVENEEVEEKSGLPKDPQNECPLSTLAVQDQELAETTCNEEKNVHIRDNTSAECAVPDNTDKLEDQVITPGIGLDSSTVSVVINSKRQSKEDEVEDEKADINDLGEKVEKPCKKDATQCDLIQYKSEGDRTEEVGVQECQEKQGQETEQVKIDIALIVNKGTQGIGEVRLEEPQKVELKVVEESNKCTEVSRLPEGGPSFAESAAPAAPKPKQRTKLQKPALLPKPRSVPKREITLPRCSPAAMGDQDMSAIPDSYDPSRVERV